MRINKALKNRASNKKQILAYINWRLRFITWVWQRWSHLCLHSDYDKRSSRTYHQAWKWRAACQWQAPGSLRQYQHTNQVVGRLNGPTVPILIPDQQSPSGSSSYRGMKARSRGSMAKSMLPKVREIDALVLQGTVQLPSIFLAPETWECMVSTS